MNSTIFINHPSRLLKVKNVQVTNSKFFKEINFFELLTRLCKMLNFTSSYFLENQGLIFHFRVTSLTLKDKKLHFELLDG